MDDVSRKREISKVPMRKLLAAVKRDIQRQIRPSVSVPKLKKT